MYMSLINVYFNFYVIALEKTCILEESGLISAMSSGQEKRQRAESFFAKKSSLF